VLLYYKLTLSTSTEADIAFHDFDVIQKFFEFERVGFGERPPLDQGTVEAGNWHGSQVTLR
jgi:hypothetical protein